jgi:hypothetical protein
MEPEIFEPIKKFPKYEIGNYGTVRSKETPNKPCKILKPYERPDGYFDVKLRTIGDFEGRSVKFGKLIHRLVAKAFVENPNPGVWKIVNHKNSNRSDNNFHNLEWCDCRMNSLHAWKDKMENGSEKPCAQYNLNGQLIKTFASRKDASIKTECSYSGISKSCADKTGKKTSGGYLWKDLVVIDTELDTSEWKYIDGFPYKISRTGQIYSMGGKHLMTPSDSGGVLCIKLHFDGFVKPCKIHRLVAETYIPNPKKLPNVSHKNGDKYDNDVENLMWCSNGESYNNAATIGKIKVTKGKPVSQYSQDGEYIKTFPSIKEASLETKAPESTIPLVCNKKRNLSGGYGWKWADATS